MQGPSDLPEIKPRRREQKVVRDERRELLIDRESKEPWRAKDFISIALQGSDYCIRFQGFASLTLICFLDAHPGLSQVILQSGILLEIIGV